MATKDRGSLRTENSAAKRRAERRAARGDVAPADWSNVDPERIVSLIGSVTRAGGLCSFGYTRDGGTYTVTIILDGDKTIDYCRPTEDVNEFIANLAEDFADSV